MFEKLNELWHASPFVPFTIHLSDGRKFEIPHPDFFMLPPNSSLMVVTELSGRFHIINGRGIVSVSVQGEQVAP